MQEFLLFPVVFDFEMLSASLSDVLYQWLRLLARGGAGCFRFHCEPDRLQGEAHGTSASIVNQVLVVLFRLLRCHMTHSLSSRHILGPTTDAAPLVILKAKCPGGHILDRPHL